MKKEIKDFLITYGWAILIIILFIFFIIKNPYYFFPQNKDTLVILDKKITTNGTIELIIKNNMEIDVYNLTINISICNETSEKIDLKKFTAKKVVIRNCRKYIAGYGFNKEVILSYKTQEEDVYIEHKIKKKIKAIVEET